jgi:hypothetical protein
MNTGGVISSPNKGLKVTVRKDALYCLKQYFHLLAFQKSTVSTAEKRAQRSHAVYIFLV